MRCWMRSRSGGSGSECDDRPQPEHQLVPDASSRLQRVWQPAAGIDDILHVRLQHPPARDLRLIGQLDDGLVVANGDEGARVKRLLLVQLGDATADVGQSEAKSEGIIVAPRQRRLERKAAIVSICTERGPLTIGRLTC